jgi:hypothetical protein
MEERFSKTNMRAIAHGDTSSSARVCRHISMIERRKKKGRTSPEWVGGTHFRTGVI